MADRTVSVRFEAVIDAYQRAMAQMSAATNKVAGDVQALGRVTEDTARKMQPLGTAGFAAGAAVAAGMGLAVKAAIDWESAFAGVRKTVEGTDAELGALSDGIREMALGLPATATEIAAVAEAAGALGVETHAIESFARVIIDLSETTDLTADAAASAFARIANVMGTAQSDFDRMGATIVALGNNGASTESEIAELANRLAAAGAIAGLSEADVFAFAETLASVGVEAEAGGTALSKVFTSIRDAVLDGGDKLEVFARTAGTTASEFAAAFRQDAAGAVASFIEGLGRVSNAGQSTTAVFEELELTDQRLMRALLSTGEAGGYLRQQITLANQAWEDNTALTEEAAKRYETTAAQLEILRNHITEVAMTFGEAMLPAINLVVGVLTDLVDGFGDVMNTLGPLGPVLAAMVASVGLLGGGFLILLPQLIAVRTAMQTLAVTAPTLAVGLRGVSLAAGGIGALLAVASGAMAIFGRDTKATTDATEEFAAALRQEADAAKDAVDALIAKKLVEGDLDQAARTLGVSTADVAAAIKGESDLLGRLAAMHDELAASAAAARGAGADHADELDNQAAAALVLIEGIERLNGDYTEGENKAFRTARAQQDMTGATDAAADSMVGLGEGVSEAGDELDDLTDRVSAYLETTTAAARGQDDITRALRSLGEQVHENGAALDANSEAGLANRQALDQVVDAVAELAAAGELTNEQLQTQATRLHASMIEMGFTADEADRYRRILLGIPTSVTTEIDLQIAGLAELATVLALAGDTRLQNDLPNIAAGLRSGPALPTVGPVPPSDSADDARRKEEQHNREIEELFRMRHERLANAYKLLILSRDEYLASLDEQIRHEVSMGREGLSEWMRLVQERMDVFDQDQKALEDWLRHQGQMEDNMHQVGDLGTQEYVRMLKERLAALEKYSDEWTAVWEQINEVENQGLQGQLEAIAAYEAGRQWQKSWDALLTQRLDPIGAVSSTTTVDNSRTYNPSFTVVSSDPTVAASTANQKLRDYAAAVG